MTPLPDGGAVTIVVCGAGPASRVDTLVELAQRRGWAVAVVATPAALGFLDVARLEAMTGNPVRSEYRMPERGKSRTVPNLAAVVVAPATYNSICKLAIGVNDTYALGVVAEAIGRRIPVVILPFVNSALAARVPLVRAIESLRTEGVRVLFGVGGWLPHPPGTGGEHLDSFPWAAALDAIGAK